MKTEFHDKVVVVTGAGSGIGRALASALAERGARLALSDIDPTGLRSTVTALEQSGAEVHAAPLDVADRGAWSSYADDVISRFGVVHQLFNNAGIARSSLFETMTGDGFDQVLDVNLRGVVDGTRAFLPHLIASGRGTIVNIASLNGLMGYSGLSAYCTSKFAVRGFTEALQVEMLAQARPVQVHLVMPGGVKTDISASSRRAARAAGTLTASQEARGAAYEAKYLKMAPADAARTILDSVAQGRGRIMVGRDAKLADVAVRLLPRFYPHLVARVQRKEA